MSETGRWLKLTLAWPFRLLVQSPPCTSFSGGGNQNGIQDEAGELMLHGMGIASVVDAQISCGENVRGLIGHPHWPLILRFAHLLGLRNLQVEAFGAFSGGPNEEAEDLLLFLLPKVQLPH